MKDFDSWMKSMEDSVEDNSYKPSDEEEEKLTIKDLNPKPPKPEPDDSKKLERWLSETTRYNMEAVKRWRKNNEAKG